MSNCIKDLFDYSLVKKCSKCGIISLKSNFYKDKSRQDGLHPYCISCKKEYFQQNKEKINEYKKQYIKNRIKTDVNYRLITNTRSRIYKSLKGITKQSSTKEILGIDVDTYRKWIEFQFTPEMNWSNIEIDHVKAICMFDVSDDEQLKEAFSWKTTQPLLKQDNRQKGTTFKFLENQLQFIEAYQFLKLNGEEGLN